MNALRFEEAERELERAIALDPVSAPYREWLALLYSYTRRPADALAEAERAVRNDPQSPTARGLLAQGLLQTGRCDDALEELKALSHLRPPLLRAAIITAQCHAVRQRWQDAIELLRPDSASGGPLRLANLGFMLGRAGRTTEARQILGALRQRAARGDAYFVAIVHAGLGEFDQAFEWLERSTEDRSLHYQVFWPAFEALHRDPRFDALIMRLGVRR
jgi:tetratricopeptide (TPR) repeat protein